MDQQQGISIDDNDGCDVIQIYSRHFRVEYEMKIQIQMLLIGERKMMLAPSQFRLLLTAATATIVLIKDG